MIMKRDPRGDCSPVDAKGKSRDRHGRPASKNRHARLGMDDEAISAVVGSLMVFSILVTTTVAMQVTFVPVWDEEKEVRLVEQVRSQFSELKGDVDRSGSNDTALPISHGFTLGTQTSGRWLRSEGAAATLRFDAEQGSSRIEAEIMDIFIQNGRQRALLSESWTQSSAQDNITKISSVDSLRVRFTNLLEKLEFKKNAATRLDILDADGLYGGSFIIYVPEKDKEDVWIRVFNSNGEMLVDQEYASDVKYKEHNSMWVDTLDPSWPFAAVLEAAKAPFDIQLTYNFPELDPNKWPTVNYAISYKTISETGEEVYSGGATGHVVNDYLREHDSGVLRYKSNTKEMPAQELIFEHGALLNHQDGFTSMVVPPHFEVQRVGDTMLVRASIPRLSGPTDAVTGTGEVVVTTRAVETFSLTGLSDALTIRLGTEYPEVWAKHFRIVMAKAGYAEGLGFAVQTTTDEVVLDLDGLSNTPDVRDVQIDLVQNHVEIRLP